MKIGGLQPFTLSDFPGRMAAIVFAQGCNVRCRYCHNGSLIPPMPEREALIPESEALRFLESRRGRLDGVVVSGGEPTLQADLPEFLRKIRAMGYQTKLDTNGSQPRMLEILLDAKLLDFIAMDIKAPWEMYSAVAGTPVDVEAVRESVRLIARSGLEHEFRTTASEALFSAKDAAAIRQAAPLGSPHRFQALRLENAPKPLAVARAGYQPADNRLAGAICARKTA